MTWWRWRNASALVASARAIWCASSPLACAVPARWSATTRSRACRSPMAPRAMCGSPARSLPRRSEWETVRRALRRRRRRAGNGTVRLEAGDWFRPRRPAAFARCVLASDAARARLRHCGRHRSGCGARSCRACRIDAGLPRSLTKSRTHQEITMASDTLSGGADGESIRDLPDTMDQLALRTRDLQVGANGFARAMTSAFTSSVSGGKQFDNVLKSLALRLSDLSLKMALAPVTRGVAGGINQLFQGLFGTGGSSASGATGATAPASASLAAAMGAIKPFAAGGVIGTPTYF